MELHLIHIAHLPITYAQWVCITKIIILSNESQVKVAFTFWWAYEIGYWVLRLWNYRRTRTPTWFHSNRTQCFPISWYTWVILPLTVYAYCIYIYMCTCKYCLYYKMVLSDKHNIFDIRNATQMFINAFANIVSWYFCVRACLPCECYAHNISHEMYL